MTDSQIGQVLGAAVLPATGAGLLSNTSNAALSIVAWVAISAGAAVIGTMIYTRVLKRR